MSRLLLALAACFLAACTSTTTATASAPPPPTGLTATAGDGKVTLTWNASTGAVAYNVWRRLSPAGSTWRQLARVTARTYTDTAVTNGTSYTYAVRAVNSAGQVSASSLFVTATPTAAPAPTPTPTPTPDPTPTPTPDPTPAPALLWRGDFETGDLSQWGTQYPDGHPMTITTSPVDQGTYAAKFTLAPGWLWNGTSRSELVGTGPAANLQDGQVRYFAWSVYLPADFQQQSTWRIVAQWKNGGTGSPPFEMKIDGDHWQLDGGWNGGDNADTSDLRTAWTAPFERGRWTRFVLGALFKERNAAGPYQGWLELWKDGVQVLPRTPWKTLYLGRTSYLKAGLYRNTSIGVTDTVIQDGWRMGDSYDSVTAG